MLRGCALCTVSQEEIWKCDRLVKVKMTNICTVHETLSKFMIDSLRRIEKQEWCSISRHDSYFFFIKEPSTHLHHIIIKVSPKDRYNITVELWTFGKRGESSNLYPVTGFSPSKLIAENDF